MARPFRSAPMRNQTPVKMGQLVIFAGGTLFGFFVSSLLFLSSAIRENFACTSGSNSNSLLTPAFVSSKGVEELTTTLQRDDAGWKTIHIFYGSKKYATDDSTIPAQYFYANEWFSQYRQDEIVSRLLHGKRNGYFIDLAANDAIRISNTYALETFFNWTGLCLEPNPIYWNGLSFRECDVVAAVVGSETMNEVSFRFPKVKAPKGGIVGKGFDNKQSESNESRRRFTVKLKDVFRRFNVPRVIDYISLDVEGSEDLVMSAFPFQEYQFNIMTLERPSQQLRKLLDSNDYVLLKSLKERTETIWVHQSMMESLDLSALKIDSEHYKYRETGNATRIAPEMGLQLN